MMGMPPWGEMGDMCEHVYPLQIMMRNPMEGWGVHAQACSPLLTMINGKIWWGCPPGSLPSLTLTKSAHESATGDGSGDLGRDKGSREEIIRRKNKGRRGWRSQRGNPASHSQMVAPQGGDGMGGLASPQMRHDCPAWTTLCMTY